MVGTSFSEGDNTPEMVLWDSHHALDFVGIAQPTNLQLLRV